MNYSMNETFQNKDDELKREVLYIKVEDIIPNRFQPRLTFDIDALTELANSIKEHGIIQPLVVRKVQDKYEIIAGERRYKASVLIGLEKVPCIVMNMSDNESAEVAVIENIQRKEMSPLEEAKSFKKLLDKGYLTQEQLAKRMGKSQSSVANKLRLLNLDEMVQDAILNGKISERHARSLLRLPDNESQRKVLTEIIDKKLTVRQTDDLIKERYGLNVLEEPKVELTNSSLGTSVNLTASNNNVSTSNMGMFNSNINLSTPNVNLPESNINMGMSNNNINLDTQNVNMPGNNMNISTPNVDIPNGNIMGDVNPQLRIMNGMGMQNRQFDISNVDNSINPTVFSGNTVKNEVPIVEEQESIMVDINKIKENSFDIRKEEPKTDISSLMRDEKPRENKFFINFDEDKGMNSSVVSTPKYNEVVNRINKNIDDLRLLGNNIKKEEEDLGNSYKITIIIDK